MTGGLIIKVGMHQISEGDANIPILAKKKNPFIYFFFFFCHLCVCFSHYENIGEKPLKNDTISQSIRPKGNKLVLKTQV